VTVLETIQRSVDFLAKKGVESPRLQAELLLAHVLKVPRMRLYLDFERAVGEPEVATLRELVRRRGQREPLQHILGSACFCGLDLAVDARVLIPRPETEMLAEFGWQQLQALAGEKEAMVLREGPAAGAAAGQLSSQRRSAETPPGPPVALDFGTGSGCIAISLAVNCPAARVVALDISEDALALARQNAARHEVGGRIQFFAGDGFTALPAGARFDVIVANPPYIPGGAIAGLEPEVRDHDPRGALDGGADGLDYFRRLAGEAGAFLETDGRVFLEFGDGQADAVRRIFEEQKWIVESVRPDYNRRLRFLTVRRTD
jgi:release factor glutamine methyltransferase